MARKKSPRANQEAAPATEVNLVAHRLRNPNILALVQNPGHAAPRQKGTESNCFIGASIQPSHGAIRIHSTIISIKQLFPRNYHSTNAFTQKILKIR